MATTAKPCKKCPVGEPRRLLGSSMMSPPVRGDTHHACVLGPNPGPCVGQDPSQLFCTFWRQDLYAVRLHHRRHTIDLDLAVKRDHVCHLLPESAISSLPTQLGLH